MSATIRQHIIDLLLQNSLDLEQLSQALGLREQETLSHLPHVAKSLATRGGRLRIQPAACALCGFEFQERRRFSPPGRCPRCKKSRIQGPWYFIAGLKRTSAQKPPAASDAP